MARTGLAFDASGNLFITDYSNNRIRVVNTIGIINTIAGSGSVGFAAGGYSGDGGQATTARLNAPFGITFDVIGNLFIGRFLNKRIRMINTSGIISTIAGNGTGGFSGDGVSATASELNWPTGVTFDARQFVYS